LWLCVLDRAAGLERAVLMLCFGAADNLKYHAGARRPKLLTLGWCQTLLRVRLLEIAGGSTTAAIAAAALVGPAQVAARLVEFGALRTVHPLVSAPLAAMLHPIGAVILGLIGPGAITAFAVLHGAGNGLLTIGKGTVPLAIFGPVGYGLRSGVLGAPARATQAASPLLFGLLMDYMGIGVLAVSAGLSLGAFFVLLMLRARPTAAPAPA
jgi:hypothetical protein